MTWNEMLSIIRKHNQENGITSQYSDDKPLTCIVVFKNESWPSREEDYSLEARSYRFRNDEKYFLPEMGGNSLYGTSLDGSDVNVRLDQYLGRWIIEDCYFE